MTELHIMQFNTEDRYSVSLTEERTSSKVKFVQVN